MTTATGYTPLILQKKHQWSIICDQFPAIKNCPCHYSEEQLQLGCFWPKPHKPVAHYIDSSINVAFLTITQCKVFSLQMRTHAALTVVNNTKSLFMNHTTVTIYDTYTEAILQQFMLHFISNCDGLKTFFLANIKSVIAYTCTACIICYEEPINKTREDPALCY